MLSGKKGMVSIYVGLVDSYLFLLYEIDSLIDILFS